VHRRQRILLASTLAAALGVSILVGAILWWLWRESVAAETRYADGLAATLGQSTEHIILDARDLLASLDRLPAQRCSEEHLQALRVAAISRPHIRAIGFWRATERLCGVGFLPPQGLKPEKADRIYDNGVIAWWPGPQTEVAGVQLFLMRFGDHDVAIDPRRLLDLGNAHDRQAVLWVENLRMASTPRDVSLPRPGALAPGVTLDREHDVVLSRFSRSEILPIEVVATEPLDNFWNRHATKLLTGAVAGLILLGVWLYLVLLLSRHQLSLAAELQQAIARDEIRVRYQPVIELSSGRCVGAEALARWSRETGETVPPDVFIPVAEDSGLIQGITLCVLRTTVRELKPILREFPHLSVNVNLSRDDLKDDRLGNELTHLLAHNGVASKAIKLEITERALVNSDVSRDMIRGFRSRGHQVAVDDFGTGYSSLSYLQSFELDVLKIDKSFVDAIGTEAATSQVIVYVIEMAKSLGLDLVAEGVETPEQVHWLLQHDVRLGQGYLYSKPLGAGEFLEFLRNNQRRHGQRSGHGAT
jgi:sensor c-di-GMP phosphodiesterase-like protein